MYWDITIDEKQDEMVVALLAVSNYFDPQVPSLLQLHKDDQQKNNLSNFFTSFLTSFFDSFYLSLKRAGLKNNVILPATCLHENAAKCDMKAVTAA